MSTLRSAIWRIAQSTTECDCAICTSCTGSGRIASPAAGRQPGSRPPTRQQDANQAAGRQPGSRTPARQQDANQAAGRQPGSRPPTGQQDTSPAAGRQPGSRTPTRQQAANRAAGRQPGSRTPARQQDASPAAMLYTRLRGRAHPLSAALMFLRACADAQVLRTRPRAMRVRKRESLVGL
jgi:hypothetical protein